MMVGTRRERGVSMAVLQPLAQRLKFLGGDPETFLRALGVDEATSIDLFVPGSRVAAAFALLPRDRRNAAPALALVEASPTGTLGFLDYLFVASATLSQTFERLVRLYGALTELVELRLSEADGLTSYGHVLQNGVTRVTALTEFAFAVTVSRARAGLGDAFAPVRVSFTHAVTDPRPFERFFRSEVAFQQPSDELVFTTPDLAKTFSTADPSIATFLERRAFALCAATTAVEKTFRDRVYTVVDRKIRNCDEVGAARIARELCVSTRTLQRTLSELGTSHRRVVAEVQRDLAFELLARSDVPIVEVALRLGFSQQPAFHRAFARWTGMTPGECRARRVQSGLDARAQD